ncbi:MAG: hypothetical protein IT477_10620 [Rhodanobacteraceae bacterium]|nr:hypothetical protein [Rhodanobacteraceae bacterium]
MTLSTETGTLASALEATLDHDHLDIEDVLTLAARKLRQAEEHAASCKGTCPICREALRDAFGPGVEPR